MEETISLQDIFQTLKKRLGMIAGITIAAIVIAAIISFYVITPMYQATTQILVNQQSSQSQQVTTSEIQTNLQLINTYSEIIKSPAILDIVNAELDLELTASQLASKITVSNANNSQILAVSVQDESHAVATDIVNTIATVFQKEITTLMNVDNVNILSPAMHSENPSPVSPNKVLNMAIAAVLGLMIGVGLAFLLEYLDTTIKSEKDVEDLLELPVIGLVSPITEKDLQKSTRRRA
ncbi:YveK family protein [Caryophanon tenue]|uniref:Capsular biosynthesis protein n=1 Tax=Caryophanon tenue TaxID=33978 RepID=A0A1C0Y829_9BACL|nr:Wzz/FepE/Etk N-terminal domain-containing protein [Caryophanon tenue]OCS83285.1 capsular biosynthesis protein [Caryophanon tenue]